MKTRISLLPRMGFDRPFSVTNPLQVVEAELADPGPEEVLVKILREVSGQCDHCRVEVTRRLADVANPDEVITVNVS